MKVELDKGDALILVDVQNCFLPGGSLGVQHGDEVVPVLNRYIQAFEARSLPVFATRDWHPADHISFQARGGPWPPHCLADTDDAAFAGNLAMPKNAHIISKATAADKDAYSGFQDTDLDTLLRAAGVRRVFVGGLATDYCVLNTVKDARRLGYETFVLEDAVRAVNVNPQDGRQALAEMQSLGAQAIQAGSLAAPSDGGPLS